MHYLSSSGNFFNSIVITEEPKDYSIRQVDEGDSHFFIVTIAEHNADHYKFASDLITNLRMFKKLKIRAVPHVNEDMHIHIRAFMNKGGRSLKNSYFPVYVYSPIPTELIALAENKIEGIDLGEGIIPSQSCEWM